MASGILASPHALLRLFNNLWISSFWNIVDWNCKIGPSTSDLLISNKKGLTNDLSIVLDKAPASKDNHGAFILSLVTHKIPNVEFSNSVAISVLHLAPLSMSSDETYGFIDWITEGNQSRKTNATWWLLFPDQLIKTFIKQYFSLRW